MQDPKATVLPCIAIDRMLWIPRNSSKRHNLFTFTPFWSCFINTQSCPVTEQGGVLWLTGMTWMVQSNPKAEMKCKQSACHHLRKIIRECKKVLINRKQELVLHPALSLSQQGKVLCCIRALTVVKWRGLILLQDWGSRWACGQGALCLPTAGEVAQEPWEHWAKCHLKTSGTRIWQDSLSVHLPCNWYHNPCVAILYRKENLY